MQNEQIRDSRDRSNLHLIKVGIVAQNRLYRDSLVTIIRSQTVRTIVAATVEQLVRLCNLPDVIVLEVNGGYVQLVETVRNFPTTRLILTNVDVPKSDLIFAVQSGVVGFILCDASDD